MNLRVCGIGTSAKLVILVPYLFVCLFACLFSVGNYEHLETGEISGGKITTLWLKGTMSTTAINRKALPTSSPQTGCSLSVIGTGKEEGQECHLPDLTGLRDQGSRRGPFSTVSLLS